MLFRSDPDEEGVPQEALDLAEEWTTTIDADPPSEPTADDRPGHATDFPHDVLRGAAEGVRSKIDPALHEYVVQALMSTRSCLEVVHDLKLPGLRGQLVQTVLEAVRETRMRVPLDTVIEDLDQEVEALSRMTCEQGDPRPSEGTGREKIVVQVFLDAEVEVNVAG